MKKYIKIVLFSLIGLVFIGTFVFLWKKSRPEVVKYELITPKIGEIVKKTVATGKVEPRDEVLIKPQISGIVAEVYKHAGKMITQGDIIAKVKVIPEMGQLTSAESRVNMAKISLNQAKAEYERNQKLFKNGVISKDDFEKIESQYQKTKEDTQNAQDNLEIIKDGISKRSAHASNTMIRATITGMLLDIPIKVGNSVIQSNNFNDGTTIASIADMGNMIFKGKIDETEVGRIKEGMPISLTVGALQDLKFDALLEYISPKGVEENGAILFEIKAAAKIPNSVFVRAGYSANAEIIIEKRTKIITIPESTVEMTKDSSFVYVFKKDESDKQIFEKRPVTVGLSDGVNIQIVKGITLKDKLRGSKIDKNKMPK